VKAFRINAQDKASPGSSRSRCRISYRKVDAPAEYFRQQLRGQPA